MRETGNCIPCYVDVQRETVSYFNVYVLRVDVAMQHLGAPIDPTTKSPSVSSGPCRDEPGGVGRTS